jgi:hypothetical protein
MSLSYRVWLRLVGAGGLMVLLMLPGCQFLPPEFRSIKPPIRLAPLKHEVTVQSAPGMGPAPFRIDQANAGSAEVQLTVSNPTASTIRIIWTEGKFITSDSIVYAIGVKSVEEGASTASTTIKANGTIQITVVALTKDGKPVVPEEKSIEAPYRVGLKLAIEHSIERWNGTVWIFVS